MRTLLLTALIALLPSAAAAQFVQFSFVEVRAYAAPTDRGIWADINYLPFQATDAEMMGGPGVTLYAGPSPTSGAIFDMAEFMLRVQDGRANCESPEVACMAHVVRRGGREGYTFPVRANVHGLPEVNWIVPLPALRLSDEQAARFLEMDVDNLVLGDGNTLTSADPGTRLLSSRPGRPDCGDPQVSCGVVYEIETTLAAPAVGFIAL